MPVPKKSFGQHFLHDQTVIDKIIAAAEPERFSHVVEVGPGTGALTKQIGVRSGIGNLTLIEADRDLIASLKAEYPKADVVLGDAAVVDWPLSTGHWLLIGNLPYNAASAIIMHALSAEHPPSRMVVMVQKEVGERLLGLPGSMSVLSVAAGLYAQVEKVCIVKPGAFNPPPKVDSMVLRLTTPPSLGGGRVGSGGAQVEHIIALAKAAFANRRKFMASNIAAAGLAPADAVKNWLTQHGFTDKARAEELKVQDWVSLWKAIKG